ncbi:unnamed protein product [Ostreobium quekettii]|uniref:Uncharacterized protein n=1 Tax=Ostreobium quekettii TaxID=121088 RepID=A0A8S1J0G6_9CHLO|nr:unnamed protein product [Ostreobium quekettii]
MYDFNGMKSDLKSFRHLEPSEGHPVMALSFSPSGDSFLVVTGAATAKIYDRNGFVLGEFVRGDMYIRDMKNTKGHVSGLTSGKWHPNDRATALTCSDDGTLRLWDTMELVQKSVVKPTLRKPGRVAVTSCTFSHDGGLIAGGLRDGSIQLWSASGKFGVSAAVGMVQPPKAQMIQKQTWTVVSRAASIMRDAHAAEADITSLCFGHDGQTLLSRAMDHTLKVWDIRKFSTPRLVLDGLTNMQSSTGCCLSPTETLAVTGLSDDGTGSGGVAFVDLERGEVVRKVAMAESVVPVLWHPKLNQILVGMGGRSTGQTSILYNPDFSERGALLCVGQAPRRRVGFDFEAPVIIHNPHALPMYREPRSKKRQREKDRGDPVKTKRPDSGMMAGVGKGGRIGATGGTLLTQYLLKHKGKMVPVEEEQDPRKAILRHSKEDFSAFTAAYKKTQPTPMFAQDDDDEEEGED